MPSELATGGRRDPDRDSVRERHGACAWFHGNMTSATPRTLNGPKELPAAFISRQRRSGHQTSMRKNRDQCSESIGMGGRAQVVVGVGRVVQDWRNTMFGSRQRWIVRPGNQSTSDLEGSVILRIEQFFSRSRVFNVHKYVVVLPRRQAPTEKRC